MNTPHDICSAMRNVRSLSHADMTNMLACFAAMAQKPSALGDKCTRVIVDMLDEITGQIENDQIEQQKESAWATDNQRHWNAAYKALEVA